MVFVLVPDFVVLLLMLVGYCVIVCVVVLLWVCFGVCYGFDCLVVCCGG